MEKIDDTEKIPDCKDFVKTIVDAFMKDADVGPTPFSGANRELQGVITAAIKDWESDHGKFGNMALGP